MKRTVDRQAAHRGLSELLVGVSTRGDEVIIEEAGEPIAVIIPAARYRQIDQAREHLREMYLELRESGSENDPDEAERVAVEVVNEIRAERRRGRHSAQCIA
jgi:prevent-host-death family protein